MNREKIRQLITKFSCELDRNTLDAFTKRLNCRLTAQRLKGRTGWELMTEVELADLMCKVMNRAQEKGENFYIDLANLLMFCHALEVDPQDIMVVLEEHLGRNWQCRQQELDKHDTPHAEIEAAGVKPVIMDAVKQIPDGAVCEIYRQGEDPVQAVWSVQEQEFIVSCEGGGAVGYHPMGVSGYHIISEPKQPEPQVEPMEAMPEEPDPLISGRIYILTIDGSKCFYYYKYREARQIFKQCNDAGSIVKAGFEYDLNDPDHHIEWELVNNND